MTGSARPFVASATAAVVGSILTALVMYLMRPALSAPATAKDALTIEQAARWTYDKDAIRIGDLTISADHKALLVAVPGISAKIRTDTDDIMIVALHVVLLDENGNLITAECLSNPLAGLIEPGEEKTVAIRLQTSSRDIARAKHVRLGVTRAPVHRVSGGGTV